MDSEVSFQTFLNQEKLVLFIVCLTEASPPLHNVAVIVV